MSWVNSMKTASPLYKRRCKYCKSELAIVDVKGIKNDLLFKKVAPAALCPRCDGPSPAVPLGTNPNGESDGGE